MKSALFTGDKLSLPDEGDVAGLADDLQLVFNDLSVNHQV